MKSKGLYLIKIQEFLIIISVWNYILNLKSAIIHCYDIPDVNRREFNNVVW